MSKPKFDPALPRRMYWRQALKNAEQCPECGGAWEADYQVYFMVVKEEGKELMPFLTANDSGRFCAHCPVVLLDYSYFAETAAAETQAGSDAQFSVLGLLDLEAIPEDKRDLPLGEDGNPVPLVEFLEGGSVQRPKVPLVRTQQKIGRNDPCSCGSGKKYKKCCGN